jgi:tryptophan-rich sensory protein
VTVVVVVVVVVPPLPQPASSSSAAVAMACAPIDRCIICPRLFSRRARNMAWTMPYTPTETKSPAMIFAGGRAGGVALPRSGLCWRMAEAILRPAAPGSMWRAGIVLVPLLLVFGGLSARLSGSTEDNGWFQTLVLPALQPPGAAFGIAWSILYTVLAVAAAIVWGHKAAPGRRLALGLFALGIAINLTWSPTFFRFHLMLPALGIIAGMFLIAAVTLWAFARVSHVAAWLLVPYLGWLLFAAFLNFEIWRLNPAADAFQLGV